MEVRQQYLFALANLCHVSPTDMGMTVRDFYTLCMNIDQYIKDQNRG